MRDALLEFGTINFASTNLTTGVGLSHPALVDLNVARDVGAGNPLVVEFSVDTLLGATGDFVIYGIAWITDDAATDLTTQLLGGGPVIAGSGRIGTYTGGFGAGAYVLGAAKAGVKLYMPLPPLPIHDLTAAADATWKAPRRYLAAGVWSVSGVAAGTVNSGTLSARVISPAESWRPYASGFTA